MNYTQAETYVLSFTDYEKIPGIAYSAENFDLRRVEAVLSLLGDPHLGTKTVHVAGTKGKGSTAAMIAQVLITAGYKVGLYTSPHLITLSERIRINNVLISEQEFALLATEIQPLIEKVNKEASFGKLTTFEILTIIAFAYFKKNRVDIQAVEVGLGGRLDATNVARGDVCVITSLSLDHTAVLGNTVAKIAVEKAGIIKPGSIVVNFPQPKEALEVIRETCKKQGATLIQLGEDITWSRTGGNLNQQSLTVASKNQTYDLQIPLIGDYQLENAAAAVAALEALTGIGIKISRGAIVEGLEKVKWPGRLQILQHQPLVVVDGAHNVFSIRRMLETIKNYFEYDRCNVIFGVSSDKDIPGIVRELASFTPHIIVTRSSHPRSATSSALVEEFSKMGIKPKVVDTVSQGIAETLIVAQKTDLILITGSLFVVAEAIESYSR